MTRQDQKQLPNGWKWVRLGDVIAINPREQLKKYSLAKKVPMEALVPWQRKIAFYKVTEFKGGIKFRNGDTLLARITPSLENGKTAFVDILEEGEIGFGSTEFIVLRAKQGITIPKYIYYLARSPEFRDNAIKSMTGTSGRQRVQHEAVEEYFFSLPPLPEQKAIAEVLSSLDDKIELLQEQNKTLEEMAQTLFRKWFIDNPERKGWKKVRLGEATLATIIKSGIEPFTGYKTYLATRDVQGLEIVGGTAIMYNSRPSRANMQPSVYSVWFAKKWGVQKLLMFDEFSNNVNDYVLSTGFLGLKTKPETHYYIWLFVITDEFQEIKNALVSGSVQPDITNAGVMKILIEAPPIKLLESFNHKVKGMFAKISANKRQIEVLRNLRDLLLPKLINGEVRAKI